MKAPALYVLADDDARWPLPPPQQARAACEGGAVAVQLRCKHAGDSQALLWAREIRALTRAAKVLFFVNDRFDLALLAEADGVHLGQGDLPPQAIPQAARAQLALGLSTHNEAQARAAAEMLQPGGADYIAYGPVFATATKATGYEARGLDALSRVAAAVRPLPVIAIGGITAARARAALQHGARGVAVISAVAGAADYSAAKRAVQQFTTAMACTKGETP